MENDFKKQLNNTESIWKRKESILKEDINRYEKRYKDIEIQLKHKNKINDKMGEEMKALLQLIDHQTKINKMQNENNKNIDNNNINNNNGKVNELQNEINKLIKNINELKEENNALRSELSAFDINFFNEIEDLKYRESKANEKIKELTHKLSQYEM